MEKQIQGNQTQGSQTQGNQTQGDQMKENQMKGSRTQGSQMEENQMQESQTQKSKAQGKAGSPAAVKPIRQLSAELAAGTKKEENLPVLMNRLASAYGQLSLYNLAMELSVFLESVKEERIKPDKAIGEIEEVLLAAIRENVLMGYHPEKNEEAVKTLISVREKLFERMEMLTSYTDLFVLYEYILNRLEPEYEEVKLTEEDDDTVAREILQWIFAEEDYAVTNEKIRQMLSCLPVRMTKAKLSGLVEEAFSLYQQSDKQAVDFFEYMLRSACGLYVPKNRAKIYPKLEKVRRLFEDMDIAGLTAKSFAQAKDSLEEGSRMVWNLSECVDALTLISNMLLTVLLTRPYFTLEAERNSADVMDILDKLLSGEGVDVESLFAGIEEPMEQLSEEVARLSPMLDTVKKGMESDIEALMLTTVYHGLLTVERLNSGSKYVSILEEEEEEEEEGTPEDYWLTCRKNFLKDLGEILAKGPKQRNRAVMAAVLRELPIYFDSRTEVMDYVRNSLAGCHNEGEKQISIELLRSYYNYYDYYD